MDVPTYSLAERDRRWALARELMAAEEVEALVCYGEHECVEPSAVVGGRAVNLGGTLIIGEDGPIELKPLTAQLLRA
jgi:hypothetical protein